MPLCGASHLKDVEEASHLTEEKYSAALHPKLWQKLLKEHHLPAKRVGHGGTGRKHTHTIFGVSLKNSIFGITNCIENSASKTGRL